MYLKEIGIKGFKSFANKIKLNITPGITVIVGPNGCGKSNVIDAVRWLLGEQNVRSLRGTKITDMIFSGNQVQKIKNLAQVSMLFDNSGRVFSLDSEEVEVKRIVYRSGEIENYINGIPCKLKDLQELFLGTGLGKNSYSIIAQDKTSYVLKAKPTERRVLFEEASDVSAYRVKKENTMRKLEATENNLQRINDILYEVEDTLNHYKKKSDELETYRTYQDHILKLEYFILSQQYKLLQKNLNRATKKLEIYKDEISAIDKNLLFHKNEIVQTEQQRELLDKQLNEQLVYFQQNEIEKNNLINRLSLIRQKELEISKYIKNSKEDKDNLQKQYNKFHETLSDIEDSLQQTCQNGNKFQDKINKNIIILDKYNYYYNYYLKNNWSAEDLLKGIKTYYNHYQENKIKLETEVNSRYLTISEIEREINYLNKKSNDNQELLKNKENELAVSEGKSKQLAETEEKKKNELTEKLLFIEKEKGFFQDIKNELLLKNKQMDFWEELIKTAPDDSVVNSDLLTIGGQNLNNTNFFELKKVIKKIPDDLKQIFDCILDDEVKYLHLKDYKEIFFLKDLFTKKNTAKIKIIADSLIRVKDSDLKILDSDPTIEKNKIFGFADSLVSYPAQYKKTIKSVLGHILVVEDMDTAFKIAEKAGGKWTIISLDGVFINEQGVTALNTLINSMTKNNYEISSKKIEELKQVMLLLKNEQHKKQSFLELEQQTLRKLQNELKSIENQQEKNNWQLKENRLHLTEIANNIRESKNMLTSVITKKDSELKKIRNLEKEILSVNEQINDLKKDLQSISKYVDYLSRYKANCQRKISEIKRNQENYKMELSWNNEKKEFLQKRRQEMDHFIKSYHKEEKEREEKLILHGQEQQQLNSQEVALKKQIEDLIKNQNSLNNSIHEIKKVLQEKENLLKKIRAEVNLEHQNIEEKKNSWHQDELVRVQNQEKLNHLLQTIQNQYDTTIEQILSYSKQAPNQAEALETITNYKEQIKVMGHINFNAFQEYQTQFAKFEEFRHKKEEIIESKKRLITLIDEIDRIAEDHFYKTFQKVQINFQEIFRKLFHGGQVSLELSDNKKILEAGIEVLAQPPGKQVQNISLLSAGEKALTAVALLFALWKTNPTPFCFFDEIDSALDEANAIRLASYIKNEDLKNSQIIIITHQKEIMQVADALYGITMDRYGTSKLMSVKMSDLEENQN
ncbi:MAG TPA: chromosome segregation protein SMC [Atribacterota bacterium]|nr:chromosome segregation protein SMC [Atribacterota bacterium]